MVSTYGPVDVAAAIITNTWSIHWPASRLEASPPKFIGLLFRGRETLPDRAGPPLSVQNHQQNGAEEHFLPLSLKAALFTTFT